VCSPSRIVVLAVMAVLSAGALWPVIGGTIRHDVDDSEYTSLAAEAPYRCVGSLSAPGMFASGTLVANNYVLTAAHVAEAGGTMTFSLPGGPYTRVWQTIHPDWTGDVGDGGDFALIRLGTLVLNTQPAVLYTATDELGQTGVVVGFGKTGNGDDGAFLPAGTKRAGENAWERTGAFKGWSTSLLLADFDSPSQNKNEFGSPVPLDLEYCVAEGDSGGGLFLDDAGQQKLGGVVSLLWPNLDAMYGWVTGVGRVSSHVDWLTTNLAQACTMSWTSTDGLFNDAANWQTTHNSQTVDVVPGAMDGVRFDAVGSYAVVWPDADLSNTRLHLSAGQVTLYLAGRTHTLTDPSESQPSVVVGDAAGAGQALTILSGTLETQHAFLAPTTGAEVNVTVGAGATWNAAGSVFVGGDASAAKGAAELSVVDGGAVQVAGDLTVWSDGSLVLDDGTVTAPEITLDGGTLRGTGTLDADLTILDGAVETGLAGTDPGLFDTLTVTGSAALSGLLEVSLLEGFTPGLGDTWTILTAAAGITGGFGAITPGYEVSLLNGDTELLLSFAGVLLGDVNGDGVVDGLDIQPFVDLLTGGGYQAEADLNGDLVVDGLDIQPFVDIITGAGASAMPEPGTLILLAAASLGLLGRRRSAAPPAA